MQENFILSLCGVKKICNILIFTVKLHFIPFSENINFSTFLSSQWRSRKPMSSKVQIREDQKKMIEGVFLSFSENAILDCANPRKMVQKHSSPEIRQRGPSGSFGGFNASFWKIWLFKGRLLIRHTLCKTLVRFIYFLLLENALFLRRPKFRATDWTLFETKMSKKLRSIKKCICANFEDKTYEIWDDFKQSFQCSSESPTFLAFFAGVWSLKTLLKDVVRKPPCLLSSKNCAKALSSRDSLGCFWKIWLLKSLLIRPHSLQNTRRLFTSSLEKRSLSSETQISCDRLDCFRDRR